MSIGGGRLSITDADALGTADGTAATGTSVGGAFEEGSLELAGVNVTNERLQISGRQPGVTAPHLTNTGTSQRNGPIVGTTGGNQYNIDSQSGTITLTGDITMPDSSERIVNLTRR
ncbi:MAG: hypothetical protein JW829_01245 [Pirellulales bacterium]|nr:hypothetical protein [Pirellulales bacterium]